MICSVRGSTRSVFGLARRREPFRRLLAVIGLRKAASLSGKGAARLVFFGVAVQKRVQDRPVLLAERIEEVVLDPVRESAQPLQRPLPVRRKTDDVSAAVAGIATALDEPLLFELVEQSDELAAVVAQCV